MRPEDRLSIEEQQDLIRAILDRTSGPACGAARRSLYAPACTLRSRACAELLSSHLEHCGSCARLAENMTRLSAWKRLVLRPRFASEVAYVATLLILLARPAVAPLAASPRTRMRAEIQGVFRALPRFVPDRLVPQGGKSLRTESGRVMSASRRASIETVEGSRAAAVDAYRRFASTMLRVANAFSGWLHRTFGEARTFLRRDTTRGKN